MLILFIWANLYAKCISYDSSPPLPVCFLSSFSTMELMLSWFWSKVFCHTPRHVSYLPYPSHIDCIWIVHYLDRNGSSYGKAQRNWHMTMNLLWHHRLEVALENRVLWEKRPSTAGSQLREIKASTKAFKRGILYAHLAKLNMAYPRW